MSLSPPKRFRVALSFPGEYRAFVARVAESLAADLGRELVLYDRFHEAELARPDLDTYLQRLYHDESDLIAVFLCAEYEQKEWCGLEWRAIRDLIKRRRTDAIMPLRFDHTEIPGLFSTDGYVWIGEREPEEVAELILERLHIGSPVAVQGFRGGRRSPWSRRLGAPALLLGFAMLVTLTGSSLDLPAKWQSWRGSAVPARAAPAKPRYILEGRFEDGETARFLEGVQVELLDLGRSTRTDSFGRFRFELASDGRVGLRASLPGYESCDLDPMPGGPYTWKLHRIRP